ncbi:TerB family tellurite resistance protein [Aquimarina brevivitae]|uniref:Tellurite resistance protein TerB n=1 Tax=Aquimarina brevivitae TaxID=323412 RepID=A0A4Q7PIB8_9FLAO|nr:TerB family tellurite resistance protein [Aquimarina brevivitae]RZT00325.1 tellurite resistance protein TerB [Aquimarina brevivitae]
MGYSKKEKLSLLSEMIQFAQADNNFKKLEYDFIVAVAEQLGINKMEVDELRVTKIEKTPLKSEPQRILQFHRLVLLMNVDQEANAQELLTIKNLGLQMGLRPEAIETVLTEMHNYPNKVIPPQELITIFSRFYN